MVGLNFLRWALTPNEQINLDVWCGIWLSIDMCKLTDCGQNSGLSGPNISDRILDVEYGLFV